MLDLFGYSMWQLDDDIDIDNMNIFQLSQSFNVIIDKDYHGRKVCQQFSLFTIIINIHDMLKLFNKFGKNILTFKYRGNNILHCILMNPNKEIYFLFKEFIKSNIFNNTVYMSNFSYDVNDDKKFPIAYVRNIDTFNDLLSISPISNDLLNEYSNFNIHIKLFMNY